MKKILLLVFLSFNCFSQEAENFSVVNNIIVWSKVYDKEPNTIIKDLKANLSLKFTDSLSGYSEHQLLRCKGISMYCRSDFKFDFKIELKENKYKITVSNFVFKNDINFNIGYVSTSKTTYNIEEFELRNKDNTIRKNYQTQDNLNCLNKFLLNLFESKKEEW